MGKSRYKVVEPTHPHFMTCTILHWLPLLHSDTMMKEKIEYIHHNPVTRGYIEEAVHWRYSSARDYMGIDGLLDIERFW